MKYFVITDSTDTQVGLRLAGIEGVVAREEPLAHSMPPARRPPSSSTAVWCPPGCPAG